MIIKRANLSKDKSNEANKNNPKPKFKEPALSFEKDDGPRSERRRGDRRRGYRRIDDRNLISRAHEESNAIREMSSREGFEYGIENSQEQIDALNHVMVQLLEAKEESMRMAMNDIAQMALTVAEKLVRQEVAADPEIVLNITAETIKEMGKSHKSIIIKVNPIDVDIVKENIPRIYPYGDSKTNIVVVNEETVNPGSCIVETNTGLIDASFSTQLAILQKAFEAGI